MESVRARYLGVPPRDVVRILNETTETFLVRARDSDVLAVGHLAIRMGEVTLFGEVAVLVRDDHRRHGHGAQLIAAMAQAARSRGVRDLTTVARDGDPAAAPLMRSALGEVRVEVADGLATVSSELTLPPESPPRVDEPRPVQARE